jgi:hypothetical protein
MEKVVRSMRMEQEYVLSRITRALLGKEPDKICRFTM